MKLNLHKKSLDIYVFFGDSDGLRVLNLFEDFDETFVNFNLNSNKKKLEYFGQIGEDKKNNANRTSSFQQKCSTIKALNFKTEFFA